MISKETFRCGNNTLVGLDAKEVLEFLFSRGAGCGYHLVQDYMNVGFSMGVPFRWPQREGGQGEIPPRRTSAQCFEHAFPCFLQWGGRHIPTHGL